MTELARLNAPLTAESLKEAPHDPFDADRWDLSIEPYASWITHDGCRIVWDFSNFKQSPIKAEVKRACVAFKNIKTESTADRYLTNLRHFGRFVSSRLTDCGSLLDLTEREAMAAYSEYLVGAGLKPIKVRDDKIRKADELIFFHKVYVEVAFSKGEADLSRLDTWPTGRLPLRIAPHRHPPSKTPPTISFAGIPQEKIAADCRVHALFSLRNHCTSSVSNAMGNLTRFFSYVSEARPEISRTDEIDRDCVLGFMRWVNEGGCAPRSGNLTISALRSFLDDLRFQGMGVPARNIILDGDSFKVGKNNPEYFSRGEQRRLLEHLSELERPWREMLTVHYQVGMRVSELCSLTENCLKMTANGCWYLEYFQYKTKKSNSVPVTDEVAHAIASALFSSKAKFGKECPYVFADGVRDPMKEAKYTVALRKYVKDFRILADDGTMLNVRTHKFRSTVATNLINNPGVDDASLIRMMLGQSSLGQLEHYAAIHSQTMIKTLAPITARDETFIKNLGKKRNPAAEDEHLGSPLCNGTCARSAESGPCENYNACYSCPMFKPSRSSLEIFEHQLDEVEKSIAIAEANGYQRSLELHRNTKRQLEKIIEKVKLAKDQ